MCQPLPAALLHVLSVWILHIRSHTYKILDAALVPFTQAVFPAGYRFHPDDHKHCAHYTRYCFAEKVARTEPHKTCEVL